MLMIILKYDLETGEVQHGAHSLKPAYDAHGHDRAGGRIRARRRDVDDGHPRRFGIGRARHRQGRLADAARAGEHRAGAVRHEVAEAFAFGSSADERPSLHTRECARSPA